ncbi:hypothetical protein QWY16_07575 [Planococcus shenhongbingii]|uniref:hypothetical protein n=1 Tax=Planococcus shenhongbingii TaxID=3058398 RepID=UPI002628C766|nr:hypothetical protein [Planococcus sp. N016]WKA59956.1 hypothetical protein QWY16_07575 [Planococcus sp. N016]
MSFESKYLIRWGIPGWVFIFWVFIGMVFINGYNPLKLNVTDTTEALTLIISFAAIGIPVGYIFHQLSFGLLWVFQLSTDSVKMIPNVGENYPKDNFKYEFDEKWLEKLFSWINKVIITKKHKSYFHLESVWHIMLMEQNEEVRTYLEGRYRHILGTIYGLGALTMSTFCSFFLSVYIISVLLVENSIIYFILVIIQFFIFIASAINYMYFSFNLRAFQAKMLQKYLPPIPANEQTTTEISPSSGS